MKGKVQNRRLCQRSCKCLLYFIGDATVSTLLTTSEKNYVRGCKLQRKYQEKGGFGKFFITTDKEFLFILYHFSPIICILTLITSPSFLLSLNFIPYSEFLLISFSPCHLGYLQVCVYVALFYSVSTFFVCASPDGFFFSFLSPFSSTVQVITSSNSVSIIRVQKFRTLLHVQKIQKVCRENMASPARC